MSARSAVVCAALLSSLSLAACTPPAQPPPTTQAATTEPTPTSRPGTRANQAPIPPGFVALSTVDASIGQDIRYATAHNFVGRPISGYGRAQCLLTGATAEALHRAQLAARARGFSLKVYDCYRPQVAVDDFVAWAKDPDDQRMKAEFYPEIPKADLFARGYLGAPTTHTLGTTVDLTLVPLAGPTQRPFQPGEPVVACTAPAGQRFPDNSIDMGTGFDCFDPRAHTLSFAVTGAARANRLLLRDLMAAAGFTNYPNEWWHYSR